jgi:hypothetical protein
MLDPELAPWIATLIMLCVGALVWGGARTWRRGDRQKGVLMLICAAVIFGNLLIWTV